MRMLVALSNVVSTSKRSIICYAFFLQKERKKDRKCGKIRSEEWDGRFKSKYRNDWVSW